jgi:hypothetical protein
MSFACRGDAPASESVFARIRTMGNEPADTSKSKDLGCAFSAKVEALTNVVMIVTSRPA